MNKLLILSTCGTSIFTNNMEHGDRRQMIDNANQPIGDLPTSVQDLVDARATHQFNALSNAEDAELRRASAELNGILSCQKRYRPKHTSHLLLHSDTQIGKQAAETVQNILLHRQNEASLLSAGGLRTDDVMNFRSSLSSLTQELRNTVRDYQADGYYVIFNLTGGFKAVNAYIQALGMLYANKCVFTFERTDTLLEVPSLPVRVESASVVREHLEVFRKLAMDFPLGPDDAANMQESLWEDYGAEIALSVWGDEIWNNSKHEVLGEKLLPTLSEKLVLTPTIRQRFRDLTHSNRRYEVNLALDALSAKLEGHRELTSGNTMKKLRGDPRPPATHEVYLWSDGKAWRLFGYFKGQKFICDDMGPHL